MSSCPEQALFATGSYTRTIYVFDSRSGEKPIRQYQPHAKHVEIVLKLAMNSEFIVSAHSNKTMAVWDQRAGRIMKCIAVISCTTTILRKEDIYYMADIL